MWGGHRILREVRKCQGVNLVAVAEPGVDRNWLESVYKNLYPPVRTLVSMQAPRKMRTVPTGSFANEMSLLPRGCPFLLLL